MTSNVDNGFRQTGGVDNTPFFNGKNSCENIEFVITPGAVNEVLVRVNFRDGNDIILKQVFRSDAWLSDNANGFFTLPVVPNGAVSLSEGGLGTQLIAKAYLQCVSTDQGTFQISATDSTKVNFYLVAIDPCSGVGVVSRQIIASDYGV